MTDIMITTLQRATLQAAAVRNDLTIFPVRSKPGLNAGSIAKLVKTLIAKGLANEQIAQGKTPVWRTTDDGQRLAVVISDDGLAAIGMLPAGKAGRRSRAAGKNGSVAAKQGVVAAVSGDEPRKPRPGSKLAILVGLLEREPGATLDELTKATGWQNHSTRGVMSGTLRRRFGWVIVSDKVEGRGRVYRLRS
ncbi:MAG: DUF3489 domain-containing protein [Rhizobiaceae bacterium]|nr:DUF3489 domain-containing protein [Rhizobiaceae bacterium]